MPGTAQNPLRLLPPKVCSAIVLPQRLQLAEASPLVRLRSTLLPAPLTPARPGGVAGEEGACLGSGAGPVGLGSQEAEVPGGRGDGVHTTSHLSALV